MGMGDKEERSFNSAGQFIEHKSEKKPKADTENEYMEGMKLKFGILVLLPLFTMGQQNLVPNPSFEEHSECPDEPRKIAFAYPWHNVLGSCNYFHECGTNEYGIPFNLGGVCHNWASIRSFHSLAKKQSANGNTWG